MSKLSRRAAISLALSSLATSACASIPKDGEVNLLADSGSQAQQQGISTSLEGPQPGASPLEILEGFVQAGQGARDDFAIARQFLTQELASSWRPDQATYVYETSITFSQQEQTFFEAKVPVVTEIDDQGLATSLTAAREQTFSFRLVQVEGEWRISQAPDGIMLARGQFSEVFLPFTLYFYDPTFAYAVPDIRWFAERSTVATSLVRVLLEGPAPYLQGAVVTAVPEGSVLARNSVPVEQGVADIQLTGGSALSTASSLALERLRSQLTQTLTRLASVGSIKLSINDQEVDSQALENYKEPQVNPSVSPFVVGLEGNQLVTRSSLDDLSSQRVVFENSFDLPLAQPAMSPSRTYFAFTDPSGQEAWLASAGVARSVLRAEGLMHPSFDQQNWLWLGTEGGDIWVLPASQEGAQVRKIQTWLSGQKLLHLAVARDGCRALLVTSQADAGYLAWVSAIQRAEDGSPQQLGSPVLLGSTISPTGAEWNSDEEVFAWNSFDGSTELVSLSGQSSVHDPLAGIERMMTGLGSEQVLATTADGGLYIVAGRSWARIEPSLSQLSYSG